MGTPHAGGNGTEAAVFVTNIVKLANIGLTQDLIKGLQKESQCLFDATKDFRKLVNKTHIKVYSLYEAVQTNLGPWPFRTRICVRMDCIVVFYLCADSPVPTSDCKRGICYSWMFWRSVLRNECEPRQYMQVQWTW
jgi:hypothetical protein